jgi:hypothetical protein
MGSVQTPTQQYEIFDQNGCPVECNLLTTMLGELAFDPRVIKYRQAVSYYQKHPLAKFLRGIHLYPLTAIDPFALTKG